MKRLLVWPLALCLLFYALAAPASAETVRQRVAAPERFRAQYYSNTKKSVVAVDARVVVPDVPAMPEAKVYARMFTPQDAWNAARAAAPEGDWKRVTHESVYNNIYIPYTGDPDAMEYVKFEVGNGYAMECNLVWFPYDDGSADYYPFNKKSPADFDDIGHLTAVNHGRKSMLGNINESRMIRYQYDFGYNHPYYSFYGTFNTEPFRGETAPGQTLTATQARALADEAVAKLSSDYALYTQGLISGEITYYDRYKETYNNVEHIDERAYYFYYTHVFAGVAATVTSNMYLQSNEDEPFAVTPRPSYDNIRIVVDSGRIIWLEWDNPWVIGDITVENTRLLPFDEILDVFGTVAPLSIQAMEGYANNRWDISEIRLGYMPVRLKNDPNTWVLRPVWDFFGIRSFASEYYDEPFNCALTIDAVEGTIIDRNYGY